MATYTGERVKDTYESILKLKDNAALTSAQKAVTDGLGNETPLSLSTDLVKATSDVEAQGFRTPTGTSTQYLMADGSISGAVIQDKEYEHDQGVAAATWSVQHNLNKYPAVHVADTAKTFVLGQVQHLDKNNLTITFNAAFSGHAYLN